MGVLIKAKCEYCGFEREFQFGVGMMDFMTKCIVPAVDNRTGEFVIGDIYSGLPTESHVTFYNDPRMYWNPLTDDYIQWNDVYLSRTENFCPACHFYKLNFEEVGCFD